MILGFAQRTSKRTETGSQGNSVSSFGYAFREWRRREHGMSEIASAIFVLPVMIFLIFALIETGINMHYRSMVDGVTQQTVRRIANDGALYWARTTTLPTGSGAASARGWETVGTQELQNLCGTAGSPGYRCDTTKPAPRMFCQVRSNGGAINGPGAIQVARKVSDPVVCTATFNYKPVSPLSKSSVTSLGFDSLFNKTITITVKGNTVVGAES